MNDAPAHRIRLTSPEKTAELAAAFARLVRPGDVFLLSGQIGAGKTHFTRSLIQARIAYADKPVEDVPSPTFTLVQTYEVDGFEIWHSDLYRLTHPDEVEELGLFDAFDTAVCLIEWPDRLGDLAPAKAIGMDFSVPDDPETRIVDLSGLPEHLEPVLEAIHD